MKCGERPFSVRRDVDDRNRQLQRHTVSIATGKRFSSKVGMRLGGFKSSSCANTRGTKSERNRIKTISSRIRRLEVNMSKRFHTKHRKNPAAREISTFLTWMPFEPFQPRPKSQQDPRARQAVRGRVGTDQQQGRRGVLLMSLMSLMSLRGTAIPRF